MVLFYFSPIFQEFNVIVQRQGPLTAPKLCFALTVCSSGDKRIQVRSRKPDFQGILKQNLNRAKF